MSLFDWLWAAVDITIFTVAVCSSYLVENEMCEDQSDAGSVGEEASSEQSLGLVTRRWLWASYANTCQAKWRKSHALEKIKQQPFFGKRKHAECNDCIHIVSHPSHLE